MTPTLPSNFWQRKKQKKQAGHSGGTGTLAGQPGTHCVTGKKIARWINIIDMKRTTPPQYKAVLNGVSTTIYLNNAPAGLEMAIIQFSEQWIRGDCAEGDYVKSALSDDHLGKSLALRKVPAMRLVKS